MGFLDNLENAVKSMEARDQQDPLAEQRRRDQQKEARIAAPHAEELRNGAFSAALMNFITDLSFDYRTKVLIAWIDTTLRFEARGHRLELRPTKEGIVSVFMIGRDEIRTQHVTARTSPEKLAREWLATVGPRPKVEPVFDEDE
jgi:hypothetical protein